MTTTTQQTTIDDGIHCVRLWIRQGAGFCPELDQWQQRYLTRKGIVVMETLPPSANDEVIHETVTRAVRAGY